MIWGLKLYRTVACYLIFILTVSWLLPPAALCAAEAMENPSTIIFSSNMEGASIYIDGEKAAVTPASEPVKVGPGYYRVKVEKEGYTTYIKEVFIGAGENISINALMVPLDTPYDKPLPKKKKPINNGWWFWTLVLLGVGAAIGSSSSGSSTGSVAVSK